MKVYHGFDDPASRDGFVAIGNFDGVHLGHRAMLQRLRDRAEAAGRSSIAVTFDPHPIAVLRPDQTPAPLTTLTRRLELMAECGVTATIVYPTDRELLQLSARSFFDEVILGKLRVHGIVEGTNFCFGRGRQGTVQQLQEWCGEVHIPCEIIPPVSVQDLQVSSSAIRDQIQRGEVARAARFLGTPYQVQGVVSRGEARGATIGFPTANLEQVATLLPAPGVYAARAYCSAGWYSAAVNLGPNPTFGGTQRKFEVHLLDFAGNLYGETLQVEFREHLREIRKFQGIAELVSQLRLDCEAVRRHSAAR